MRYCVYYELFLNKTFCVEIIWRAYIQKCIEDIFECFKEDSYSNLNISSKSTVIFQIQQKIPIRSYDFDSDVVVKNGEKTRKMDYWIDLNLITIITNILS